MPVGVVPCTCGLLAQFHHGQLLKEPYTSAWVQCKNDRCWKGPVFYGDGCEERAANNWNDVMLGQSEREKPHD